ncbi:MAG: MogA/MoaB family molybdenum cofactor biosynthesis protein [Nitrospiraceae bacterium]|nr:MogA/MoaB family molybdenum cofactor biosynthesis protein [Nitrospiraceae bacterium]
MTRAAILTLSDKGSAGLRADESGPAAREMLASIGIETAVYEVIPDEKEILRGKLLKYSGEVDLIVTNGGTGLSPRDITPETTLEVIDKEIPGIAEAMRLEGLKKTKMAMLSRGVAGTRGQCLIINLPGSPKAVRESLGAVLEAVPHAIEKIKGSARECAR